MADGLGIGIPVDLDTDKAIRQAKDLGAKVKGALESVDMTKIDKGTLNLIHSIERMLLELDKVVKKTEELGRAKLPTQEYSKLETESKVLAKNIEVATRKVEGLRSSGLTGTSVFQKSEQELARLLERQSAVAEQMRKMRDAGADFTSGRDTQAYKDSAQTINTMNQSITTLCQNIAQLSQAQQQEAAESERMAEGMSHVGDTMEVNSRSIGSYASSIRNRLTPVIQRLGGLLRGLWGAFRNLASHLRNATQHNNHFGRSMGSSLKNILRYTLGVSSLLTLINRTRKYIGEAFKVMAQEIPEVNSAISMLGTSFKEFKAAFGTMLQPLLQSLAPILNSIIQKVVSLMNAVARFFATLTGQNYIYEATVDNYDYAESVKEAEGALASFDKLNVVQKDKDNSLALSKNNVHYEKVEFEPEDNWYTRLAEKIKEGWLKGNLEDVGSTIAEKLAGLLDSVSWEDIKAKSTKFITTLTSGINGLIMPDEVTGESPLAKSIGSFIGNAIDYVLTNFSTFVKTLHWDDLGNFIATAIDNLKGTLRSNDSWKKAGEAFGDLFQGLVDIGFELFINKNIFEGIGTDIATMIDEFIKKGWEKNELTGNTYFYDLGNIIATALINLLHEIETLIDKEGPKLVEAVNEIAQGAGSNLGELFLSLGRVILKGILLGIKLAISAGLGLLGISIDDELATFIAEAVGIGLLVSQIGGLKTAILGKGGSGGLLSAFKKKDDALDRQSRKTAVESALAGVLAGVLGALGIQALSGAEGVETLTDGEVAGIPVARQLASTISDGAGALGDLATNFGGAVGKMGEFEDKSKDTKTAVETNINQIDVKMPDVDTTALDNFQTYAHTIVTNIAQEFKDLADYIAGLDYEPNPEVDTNPNPNPNPNPPYGMDLYTNPEYKNYGATATTPKAYASTPTSSEQAKISLEGTAKWIESGGQNAEILRNTILGYIVDDDKIAFLSAFYKNAEVYGFKEGDDLTELFKSRETFNTVLTNANNFARLAIEKRKEDNSSFGKYLEETLGLHKDPTTSLTTGLDNLLKWLPLMGSAAGGFPIPYLAMGAVIPPNKPFLGVLGDQKSGTNVETPLSTIEQAVANVLSKIQIKNVFDVQGDPYRLFKVMQKQSQIEYNQVHYRT